MTTRPEPGSLAEHIARLTTLEAHAETIRGWHPTLVPGMLQAEPYARAIITSHAPALAPDNIAAHAAARLLRIDTLGQAAGRSARFVIAEEALGQAVGGLADLADQLDHMLTVLALRPTMTVRILPAGGREHPGLTGPFTLYRSDGGQAVFVETLMGSTIIDQRERTLAYALAWDHVEERAATVADSLRMIQTARNRLAAAA
ncbi:DUF5753 domain-containing protein [Streptomyces sp. NPDC091212]|uniref:DUF5753 domain-containing protein n=1 Tax=Streptomyces sp. NPDC091212 TaxID=3155191 RepID=UPI003436E253